MQPGPLVLHWKPWAVCANKDAHLQTPAMNGFATSGPSREGECLIPFESLCARWGSQYLGRRSGLLHEVAKSSLHEDLPDASQFWQEATGPVEGRSQQCQVKKFPAVSARLCALDRRLQDGCNN